MLSREEFDKAAESLVIASKEDWTLVGQPKVFLYKKSSIILPNGDEVNEAQEEDEVNEEDEACGKLGLSQKVLTMEHHVVYSATYCVPVLYFMGYHADGVPLSFEEVYDWVVPKCYHSNLRLAHTSVQGSLSQTDHPHLGMPAWFLHPCDTSSLMATVGAEKLQPTGYLISWLSIMGPVLSCSVSTDLLLNSVTLKAY